MPNHRRVRRFRHAHCAAPTSNDNFVIASRAAGFEIAVLEWHTAAFHREIRAIRANRGIPNKSGHSGRKTASGTFFVHSRVRRRRA
jgi:hypothetical protein